MVPTLKSPRGRRKGRPPADRPLNARVTLAVCPERLYGDPAMTSLRLVVPLLLSVGLFGSGCAYLSQFLQAAFTPPVFNFKNASIGNFSLSDATVNLVWEMENPNPIGLSLASLSYGLFVEEKQVVAGAPPLGLNIPAQGSTELVFPANVRFQDVAPVLETFLNKDQAAYRAAGTIGVNTPIGVMTFPLEKQGTFEVPKVPQIQLLAPRITNLGFTSATVEFPLNITNKNNFALPLSALTGGVTIAGAKVGTLLANDLGLDPKGTRTVRLPLTIHFAQATQAALALQQGTATVGFDGSLKSGTASIPLKFQQKLNFHR